MSLSIPEARMEELHRADPMISVRTLHTAIVHLTLRHRKNPPQKRLPHRPHKELSYEATRFETARGISTWLGQPRRCPDAECRRAGICMGDPPDCWRAEPPPTPLEIGIAKGLWRYHISERCSELGLLDDASDAQGA